MTYSYDGSFEGFLTVIFHAFRDKVRPEAILPERPGVQMPLGDFVPIRREEKKAQRVWEGLVNRTSMKNARLLHVALLAEEAGTEMLLWHYLGKVFSSRQPDFYLNMLDDTVFDLVQMARRVKLEVHRFHGFVRFQKTADGMLFAPVDPDHNILRLMANHFRKRFSGQHWVIYDTRRNFGIYHDTEQVREIVLENPRIDLQSGNVAREVRAMDEDFYCRLWQDYYDAVNILERKNHKQMTRSMPRRYWKYLPEKNSPKQI
jgi:probable DNA metabolism protein